MKCRGTFKHCCSNEVEVVLCLVMGGKIEIEFSPYGHQVVKCVSCWDERVFPALFGRDGVLA